MKFVDNRNFILVRPKRPFVEWINNYDEDKIPENDLFSIKTLYMINDLDSDSPEEIMKLIKKKYKEIFINELWSWYEIEDYFPKKISFNLFSEWFEYEFIDMCFDTLDTPVVIE